MLKRFLLVLFLPLLLAGCATRMTNLTPLLQVRNANNAYPVEVALASSEQALRWDSVRAQVVVGADAYPMRGTLLMTNRWEGLVPVAPGAKSVTYRYRFDYQSNAFGKPKSGSCVSKEYTLRVQDK